MTTASRPVTRPARGAVIDRQAVRCLAALLPAVPPLYDRFGFEFRLDRASGDVDLGVPVRADRAAPLAAWARASGRERTAWRHVARFATCWADDAALRSHVPFIFLEFDGGGAAPTAPCVLAGLDSPLAPSRRGGGLPAAARKVVESLLGEVTSDGAAIERACRTLPAGGRMLHVGVMLPRPGRPARISVSLPPAALGEYLGALGVADPISLQRDVSVLLAAVDDPRPLAHLDLNLPGGPADGRRETWGGIGVNLQPPPGGGWGDMLAALERGGLCLASRRRAMLAWCAQMAGEVAALGIRGGGSPYLSHVKVVFDPPRRPRAKAYVGIRVGGAISGALLQ